VTIARSFVLCLCSVALADGRRCGAGANELTNEDASRCVCCGLRVVLVVLC